MKVTALACVTLLFSFVLPATENQAANNKRDVVSFLRIVNTAQQDHFQSKGTFLEWEQLEKSTEFESARQHVSNRFRPQEMDGVQSVAGYTIQSAIGSDGKHYAFTLTNHTSTDACSIGYLSDESGLIRETRPIGCQ